MDSTERALILAKREGYAKALMGYGRLESEAEREAKRVYPMTETRLRVVTIGRYQYRVVGGAAQWRETSSKGDGWIIDRHGVEFARAVIDLLANPTETVAVDEDTAADEPAIPRCAK